MRSEKITGYDEAVKAIDAYRTPRFYDLDNAQRWVETAQYEGRASFWDDREVPRYERAPLIAYPIIKAACESNADMLFDDFLPTVIDKNLEPGDDDEAEKRAKLFSEIDDEVSFWQSMREAYETGQGVGTTVLICGIRHGELFIDSTHAKWCEPEFDDSTGNVSKLTIQYGYLERRKQTDGKWKWVGLLYRRVIDRKTDTVYKPAEAKPEGTEPTWVEAESHNHGFSRCPVIWYPFMRGVSMVNDVDGRNIHSFLHDEVECHDFALSSRHIAALTAGEPQLYEIGVNPGDNPTDVGRTVSGVTGYNNPMAVGTSRSGGDASAKVVGEHNVSGSGNRVTVNPGGEAARKKGPGFVWQYPNPDVKVGWLTLPSGALASITDHATDLRIKLAEGLAVVFLDPDNVKFASTTSGKALVVLRKRQIDRVRKHAADLTRYLLVPVLELLAEIASTSNGLKNKALLKALEGVNLDEVRIGIDWPGDPEDAEDQQKRSQTARDDLDAGLILRKTAVKHVAPTYGIENVDEYCEELEAEAAERAEKAAELMHAMGPVADDDEDPDADQSGRGTRPPGPPGSRGSGPDDAAKGGDSAKPPKPGKPKPGKR